MAQHLADHIRQLLAADEPGEAIRYFLAVSKGDELADLREQVILQSAQLEHWHKLRRDNTEDFDDLVRTRNKLNLALLLIINLRGPGVITFNQMNGLLALAESGLGVYVGQVIFALFKKGPD
jgi:hypothetical protein